MVIDSTDVDRLNVVSEEMTKIFQSEVYISLLNFCCLYLLKIVIYR